MQSPSLFNELKELTEKANKLVSDGDIEGCLTLITKRHQLCEELHTQLLASDFFVSGVDHKQQYADLLLFMKKSDKKALDGLNKERDKTMLSIQKHTASSKAISAYQNTLLG